MAQGNGLPPGMNAAIIGIGAALVTLVALAVWLTSDTHFDEEPAAATASE